MTVAAVLASSFRHSYKQPFERPLGSIKEHQNEGLRGWAIRFRKEGEKKAQKGWPLFQREETKSLKREGGWPLFLKERGKGISKEWSACISGCG